MAKIITRTWKTIGPLGRRVKRVAYGYQLMLNGKRERVFSSEWQSEADALKALSARQTQLQAGQTARPQTVTLGVAVARYLDFKQGKRSLRDDTRILTKQVLPFFGEGLPIRQLTADKIAAFEESRRSSVATCTLRNELTVLRCLLNLAHRRWNYLGRTPLIQLPKAPQGRTRYLSEEEILRLLRVCARSRNPHLSALVTLAINTGMRKGELLGLRWERIDLDTDLGFNARVVLYRTKNDQPRGVPLNQAAIAALTGIEPDPAKRAGAVFKRKNGADWGQMRRAWDTAVQRAGLVDLRFHDLRHTAASHLIARGRSLKEVQEILGHQDFSTTLRYAHLSPKHLRTAVESLNGLTPDLTTLDALAHKMAQHQETEPTHNASR